MLQLGKGALLAKLDIQHAYRIVPVHPDDRHLLGMSGRSKYFSRKEAEKTSVLPF